MFEKIFSIFLPDSRDYSFDILLKSKTLVIFSLIVAMILPVAWILMVAVVKYSLFSILSIFMIIVVVSNVAALFILRAGYYYAAANTFVIASLIGFSLYLLFGSFKFDIGVVVSGYQLLIFLIFTALFCKRHVALIVSCIILSVQVTAVSTAQAIPAGVKIMANINFTLEVIVSFSICYLLMTITQKTFRQLKEEADNRVHLERTRNLLASVSALSEKLTDSFSCMSAGTENFSSNAQNQAASAEEVTATVEQISAGIENVARSANIQMDKIKGLVSSLDELSTQINDMKAMIQRALEMTASVSDEARTGESSLNTMKHSMTSMNERSRAMSGIISMIYDISDRINLLSLNAAIEAARAGDSGRGFAVVADEISKLADQTASSVKEISSLIKAGESETAEGLSTVNNVVESLSKILNGVTGIKSMVVSISEFMAGQLSTTQKVNIESADVRERSEEIRNAAEEQKNAAGEIVKAIATINELTQANAAGAEEMKDSIRDISEIAYSLNEKVENFNDDQKSPEQK